MLKELKLSTHKNEFAHNFLPEVHLEQVNSPSGRYYVTPEGNHYQSVTTVLGQRNKESLQEWRDFVGEEEADKICKRASTRGTILHDNVEHYLRNEEINIPKTDFLNLSLFKSIKGEIDKINNIRLLENRLYSDALRLAGTVDCVAEYEGKLAVIDFKTASKIKDKEHIENYFIQTSIYSYMVEERFGIKIEDLVILIAQEYGKVQVFKENRKNWKNEIAKLIKGV